MIARHFLSLSIAPPFTKPRRSTRRPARAHEATCEALKTRADAKGLGDLLHAMINTPSSTTPSSGAESRA